MVQLLPQSLEDIRSRKCGRDWRTESEKLLQRFESILECVSFGKLQTFRNGTSECNGALKCIALKYTIQEMLFDLGGFFLKPNYYSMSASGPTTLSKRETNHVKIASKAVTCQYGSKSKEM